MKRIANSSRRHNRRPTRRSVLWGLGSAAGLAALGAAGVFRPWGGPSAASQPVSAAARHLREVAAANGLLYGAAAKQRTLAADAAFARRFVEECSLLAPELELKWDTLRPSRTTFNFDAADWLAGFANQHGLKLRGHGLVWHESLPTWFAAEVTRANAQKVLVEHISTVAARYAGRVHSWDVVNEAVSPADGRSDGLRDTTWLRLLGPDFIELAFRTAAQADPAALLVYSETWLDFDTAGCEARRNATLRLLERLKAAGTPVHALGIQGHLRGNENPFSPKVFRRFLGQVADLGLKVLITEMDVIDQTLPGDVAVRDSRVAAIYERYLSAALEEKAVIAVVTWGLSDRYTWVSKFAPRADGRPVRPLPLDADLKPKPAWKTLARVFERAPRRTS